MRATAAMTRNVICIQPDDSLEDAYSLMKEWNIRHLPVLEETVLVGMLSDRDVLLHASKKEIGGGLIEVHVPRVPVRQVMSRGLLTCRPTSSVAYVAGLMAEQKIDCVPVTDMDGRMIGLVTSTDLMQLLRDRDDVGGKVIPFEFNLRTEVRPLA